MKLAFWVVAARTCACVNCPLDVPLPADPAPAPPELPPEPPEADAQGSPAGEAVEEPLGVADALGVADIAGVEDAASASALSAPWRDNPLRMLRLLDEGVAVGEVVAEEDDGARALVRSHTTVCTDGSPPELEDVGLDDGVGAVCAFGSEPEAATAALTGASITAIAADRPIVTRFIPDLHPDRAESRSDARTRGDHQKTICIDPSRGPRSVPLTGWFGTPGNSRSVGPVVSQPCSLARRCGANTDA